MPSIAPLAPIRCQLRRIRGCDLVRGRRECFALSCILPFPGYRALRGVILHGDEVYLRALLFAPAGCLNVGLRGKLNKLANRRNAPGTPSGNWRYNAKAT